MKNQEPKKRVPDIDEIIFTDIVTTLRSKIQKQRFPPPSYDPIAHRINFASVEIPIPYDSDQNMLCKTIFANAAALKKEWSWDEMIERWGEAAGPKKSWRTVYNAGREVNGKVAAETTIKNLLLVRKFSVAVNPKYLRG